MFISLRLNLHSRNNGRDKSIFPRPEHWAAGERGITLIKLSLYSARLSLIVLASAQLLDQDRLEPNETMTEACRQRGGGGGVVKQIRYAEGKGAASFFVFVLFDAMVRILYH